MNEPLHAAAVVRSPEAAARGHVVVVLAAWDEATYFRPVPMPRATRGAILMILGVHGMFFSSRPALTRAFLRDKLHLPATDIGGGWLVFDIPAAQVSVHPREEGREHAPGMHDVSFLCDDLARTAAELRSRGVRFEDEAKEQSYGFTIHFRMPGGIRAQLWQPKYETRASLRRRPTRSRRARTNR